ILPPPYPSHFVVHYLHLPYYAIQQIRAFFQLRYPIRCTSTPLYRHLHQMPNVYRESQCNAAEQYQRIENYFRNIPPANSHRSSSVPFQQALSSASASESQP
ncbi:hypothetical protein SDJN02_10491, partial [Cucurbita argyrosperma subsp. argyrosperma]